MSYPFKDRKSYADAVLATIFKEIYSIKNSTLGTEGRDYHIRILMGRMEFTCLQNWLTDKDPHCTIFCRRHNAANRIHEGWEAFGIKVEVFMNIEDHLRVIKVYPARGKNGTEC